MTAPEWRIVRLSKAHDRASFDCGVAVLNAYLQRQAGQDERRDAAFCYVLTPGDGSTICGFYTLSAAAMPISGLNEDQRRRYPYDAVSAVLLGRLAVDRRFQGQGLGEILLIDALRRVSRAGDFAVAVVVVDPKDAAARAFYARYGFEPFADDENRMYLPRKGIAAAFPE